MTAKELLKPRFEVIELYPNTRLKVGEILTPINDKQIHFDSFTNNLSDLIVSPEKYPHLFRKLNWWEKRKKEDMPKRLKSLADKDSEDFDIEKQEIYEILDWDMNGMMGYLNIEKRQVCDLELWSPEYSYIPVD
jgi:hypothetical protein